MWFPGKEKRASTQKEMYINYELHNVTSKNNCENNPYSGLFDISRWETR